MTDDDSDLLQFEPSNYRRTADTTSFSRGLIPTIAKLEVAERVMDLVNGAQCFRDRVALSLLGNARDGLKFKPVRFDEKNLLALQIEAATKN
jgi:hypothetical protein